MNQLFPAQTRIALGLPAIKPGVLQKNHKTASKERLPRLASKPKGYLILMQTSPR